MSRHQALFSTLCLAVLSTAAPAAEVYVAPNGDDANPGTKAKPFRTLERARDAVRAIKKDGLPEGGVTVWLKGGTYFLDETLVLTSEDSGTTDSPITYAAVPGETPVISGGRAITGWTKVTDPPEGVPPEAKGRLWQTDLPDVKAGTVRFMQLFADSRRCPRSRLPEKGYYTMVKPKGDLAIRYRAGQVRPWRDLADIEVVVFHKWDEARFRIEQLDENNRILRFKRPTAMGERIGKHQWFRCRRYYLENVLAGLRPGRWHLDRSSGRLLYWPEDGRTPGSMSFVAPKLRHLVRFAGDLDGKRFVEHVTFRGVTFSHNEWPLPDDGFAGHWSDSVPIGAAVLIEGAQQCRIDSCRFTHLGTYALKLGRCVSHVEVARNEIADMGSGGIIVRGIGPDLKPDDPQPNNTRFITIADNHIHRLGLLYQSGVGVLLSEASDCRVSHNHVHDMDYIGIALGASARFPDNPRGQRNVVEYNHIHDIMKLLSDGGGIYSYGFCNDSVLHHNLIEDSGGGPISDQRAFGIHLDEPTTGIRVENNIVTRTRRAGMRWHKNRNVTVRNNIFAFGREDLLSANRNTGRNPFTRNIVYGSPRSFFEKMGGRLMPSDQFTADHNIYWDPRPGKRPTFPVPGGAFADWQTKGQDGHSRVVDPLFVDAANGDFRLRKNSPALELGIEQIDLSNVGPRAKGRSSENEGSQ